MISVSISPRPARSNSAEASEPKIHAAPLLLAPLSARTSSSSSSPRSMHCIPASMRSLSASHFQAYSVSEVKRGERTTVATRVIASSHSIAVPAGDWAVGSRSAASRAM